jgi:hypothetical protein
MQLSFACSMTLLPPLGSMVSLAEEEEEELAAQPGVAGSRRAAAAAKAARPAESTGRFEEQGRRRRQVERVGRVMRLVRCKGVRVGFGSDWVSDVQGAPETGWARH